MADLASRLQPDCPVRAATGGAALQALPPEPLWLILPFRAGADALAAALGAPPPGPGASRAVPGGRLLWAGLDRWLLRGPAAPALGETAAAIDVSDAHAGLALRGQEVASVLARLLPLDLAPERFPPGAVALSALGKIPCLVLAVPDGVELLVPRSFAGAAAADLADAIHAVAARADLS